MKMERPPSTARIWPVTKGAQARKCTACAMSSGEPTRAERRGGDDALALGVGELPVLGPGDGAGRDAVDADLGRELDARASA